MDRVQDIVRQLTWRYIVGLIMLGALATIALVAVEAIISHQEDTAALVNIASRQRMFTQRALLFAPRLKSQSASERENARRDLIDATANLEQGHDALYGDSNRASGRLAELADGDQFESRSVIDPFMRRYIAAARALAAKSASGPIAANDRDFALLNWLGTGRLVEALDKLVGELQADNRTAINHLRWFEFALWFAGILVLLGTAVLIIAPIVRRLKESLLEMQGVTSALAESEERFALAAEGASVGIRDHCDVRRDEEYWSPGLYRVLGYVPGELTARASTFNKLVYRDDLNGMHDAIERHLGQRSPLQFDCRLRHKTHGYRWFLVTGQATWSKDGAPRRLITAYKDIEDRIQALHMKSEFISTVSHELRTPLTSIMGALGLMRSHVAGRLPEKAEQLANVAYENCARLVRLINDLLDAEKLEAGKVAFDFKAESLRKLLENAKEENSVFAELHGATIVVELLERDVAVEVDEARFEQVMANLLSNAAKYSPPDGKITIAAQPLGEAVRISVSDQGPGIPADFRHRIFERFAQAEAPNAGGKKMGSGLGLSIAKSIVEAHNGTIGFDTEEGEGTTFYFVIPLAQPVAEAETPQTYRPGAIAALEAPSVNVRSAVLLLIEPNAVTRSAIETTVNDVGEITVATTCSEARPLLEHRAFDLIILDLCLPKSEREQLLRELSESGRPVPPVLVYAAETASLADWPARLRALVTATVNTATLRKTVLDELLAREQSLATRFKKSA